ncbi:DUF779 domain-containing protein [Streptomyces canus]|uniref:DUF779 domain-containing protein n=1 Tax=Streptomyces canus TaxID=58343 RepID=UPI0009A114E7|nr:DUF779 domain-containing protein [Streptomyces canus]
MPENGYAGRVIATAAARRAIRSLRTATGGLLMFVQSAGCCDGSDPMCFRAGELAVGDGDMLLGVVDTCPFYIDADQYEALGRPRLILDVAPGLPGGFSLAAGDGTHFTARVAPPHLTARVTPPRLTPRPTSRTASHPRSTS